jgi:hypothetical protein
VPLLGVFFFHFALFCGKYFCLLSFFFVVWVYFSCFNPLGPTRLFICFITDDILAGYSDDSRSSTDVKYTQNCPLYNILKYIICLSTIFLYFGTSLFTGSQAGTAAIFIAVFGKSQEFKNDNLT